MERADEVALGDIMTPKKTATQNVNMSRTIELSRGNRSGREVATNDNTENL